MTIIKKAGNSVKKKKKAMIRDAKPFSKYIMNVSDERLLDLALDWLVNLWDPYPCRAMEDNDSYCSARKAQDKCGPTPDRDCWIQYLTRNEKP